MLLQITAERIVSALVILFIGLILGTAVRKITGRLLKQFKIQYYNLDQKISNLFSYFVYGIFFLLFFRELGLTKVVVYLMAGFLFLFLFISLVLAGISFIPNFVFGLLMTKRLKRKKIAGLIRKSPTGIFIKKKEGALFLPYFFLRKNWQAL